MIDIDLGSNIDFHQSLRRQFAGVYGSAVPSFASIFRRRHRSVQSCPCISDSYDTCTVLIYYTYTLAYNIAHAIFSGTAPIIQTALVLSAANHVPHHIGKEEFLPHFDLRNDGRLRPAYYIIAVASVSLLSLVFLAPKLSERRHLSGGKGPSDAINTRTISSMSESPFQEYER